MAKKIITSHKKKTTTTSITEVQLKDGKKESVQDTVIPAIDAKTDTYESVDKKSIGAKVVVYTDADDKKYIRTDADSTKADNLGDLPTYS